MTNQSSDTQPALHAHNFSVRAGRLTKFKGRVASIAPGLSAIATVTVLFTGSAAHAANECGSVANIQVTCDAGDNIDTGITYNTSGTDDFALILNDPDMTVGGSGVKVTGSSGSEGDIFMHLDEGTVAPVATATFGPALWGETKGRGNVIVQMDGGKVTTGGVNAFALWAQINNNNTDDATKNENAAVARMTGGEINTNGRGGHALLASHEGLGAARAQMEGGKIIMSGAGSYGLWAEVKHSESTKSATASVTGGEISTGGANAPGIIYETAAIYAHNQGLGEATASLQDAKVITAAADGRGLWASITNVDNEATATAGVINGDVLTTNEYAYGVFAQTNGLGGVLASIERSTVTTLGKDAEGLWAELIRGNNPLENTATAEARVIDGHVATRGELANAVFATNNGSGDAIARAVGDTTITTEGKNSHGLAASGYGANKGIVELGAGAVVRVYGEDAYGIHAEGGAGFDVYVAGSVTGGTGDGAAIRTLSSASGAIDIASTATVKAGSGIAIQHDGVGAAFITSAGAITGDIRLGAGNDILNLTGGSFTGNLDAGDGDDTVTISATTEYDFSYTLDGGAGDNDHLTLHDRTMTSMENVTGWEHLTLKDKTNLSLDGVARLDMNLSIDAGSAFRATGGDGGLTIRGDVTNNDGSVVLSVQNGETGDEIRIEGDYTASRAGSDVFALDMGRDADGLRTDTVVITGDTSGEMTLLIAGMDSADLEGAPLVMDVVSVAGEANGTFTLVGGNYVTSDGEHAMISGAHLYKLAETGQGLALSARSESGEISWQPSAPIYDSYGASLLAFNAPSGLHARGSSQDFRDLAWSGQAAQTSGSPLWIQMGTEQITSAAEQSTTGAARDSSLWEMEIGADIVLDTSTAGLLVGGLMLSYGTGSTDVSSDFGDGSIETTGLGLGLAATWYDRRGFYVDGQVTVSSYSSDLEADRIGTLADGNGGTGYALSIEAGQQFDLGTGMTVIPQAQLSLSSVAFDDFDGERYGEQVTLEDASSQQLRLGLEFGAQEAQETRRLYGIVNLFHEFGAGSEVNVAGATLTTESEPWAVGVGIGGNYALTDRVDLFGEASYATGLSNAGDTSALSANAGLKVVF
ncbi:autotransporter outer membrane beta-barrel domain-containing protein [uncultured Ruegeria sp.]|uniref:autotransporter family protein n=1 Tax=uncultured Ruegeria sp. TaxID=259304 RepID=UPI0026370A74|nr:autotransporter outer membrane beta-barrel domain-containing protein [uncultured Ruegeria sp.]